MDNTEVKKKKTSMVLLLGRNISWWWMKGQISDTPVGQLHVRENGIAKNMNIPLSPREKEGILFAFVELIN